jgi:hypothetical protein
VTPIHPPRTVGDSIIPHRIVLIPGRAERMQRALVSIAGLTSLVFLARGAPPPGVHVSMAHNNSAEMPYSHNANFVVTPAGRLAVVYQASSEHEGAADMSIYIVFSNDTGATWTAPTRVAGNGSRAEWGPVLASDASHGLLYLFFAESGDTPTSLCGTIFAQASPDDGETWLPRVSVLSEATWGGASKCSDNQIVRRQGGGWALPFFAARATPSQLGFEGAGLVASPTSGAGPWVLLPGNVSLPPSVSYYLEPAVVQCGPSPSSLLMLLRSQVGRVYAASSTDGGESWGAPWVTGLPNPNSKVDLATWTVAAGSSSSSAGLAPGDLLLAFNPSNCTNCSTAPPCWCARSPLGVSVSSDCGASWTAPLLIEPPSGGKSFSYPTIDACGSDPVSGPRVCVVYTYLVPTGEGGVTASGIRFASFPAAMLARPGRSSE